VGLAALGGLRAGGALRPGGPPGPSEPPGSSASAGPGRRWPASNDDEREGSAQLIDTTMDADNPLLMTFYMYRAQSDWDYPLENVNAADLPGVMYYLHNEVLGGQPRKYNTTRILRYKVTVKPTKEVFDSTNTQFGPFLAFDNGRCTSPTCAETFRKFGYNVGCQLLDPTLSAYASPFQTQRGCKPTETCPGVWFSLPGQCPTKDLLDKTQQCVEEEMGGACASVTGEKICTYHYEHAGEVRMDELSGLDDSTRWWLPDKMGRKKAEYVKDLDGGVGTHFWDGKMNVSKGSERQRKVLDLFQKKYPQLPETYGQPPCDFTHV